jgi:hypothetical protein
VSADGDGRRVVERQLESVEITCASVGDCTYRLVGIVTTIHRRGNSFTCRHDGVLVGPGSLNNRPLSVAVRITERADETARADIVDLSLS